MMEWATGSGWVWGKGSVSETVWDLAKVSATVTDSASEKALERVSVTASATGSDWAT